MKVIVLPSYGPEMGLLINRGMQIPDRSSPGAVPIVAATPDWSLSGTYSTVASFWVRPTFIGNQGFAFQLCLNPNLPEHGSPPGLPAGCGVSGSSPYGMHVKHTLFSPSGDTKFSIQYKEPQPFASPWESAVSNVLQVNKWSHILINSGYSTVPAFGTAIGCFYEVYHNGTLILGNTPFSLTGQKWRGPLTIGADQNMSVFNANETIQGYYSNIWVGSFDPSNNGDPTSNPIAPRFSTDPTLLQMFYDAGKPGNLGLDGRRPYTHFGSNDSPSIWWRGNEQYTNLGKEVQDFTDLPGIAASDFTPYSGDVIAGT